jgi:dTDP-4-amino-4,6-dideoxygalactose transaminase
MTTHQPPIPKGHWHELALFGGSSAFDRDLHVGQPSVGNQHRLIERIHAVLDARWFTNDGPMVQQLEKQLADYLGVRHCLTICNGTVALEIAIRALELSGEVIVPSFTFIASAHALQWQQITPVFGDVDPATHNLDPAQVERLITSRTTAILAVHLWGRPCDTLALSEIAQRRGLKLLFDASHAFACSSKGRMIGGFGHAEIFSFHATKFFNTFEGGAIATNNDELAAKIRLMKNFGFAGYDKVIHLGTNGKMHEISAAMGLTGLESLDEFIATNLENYRTYEEELRDIPGVSLLPYDGSEKGNYQYIVVEIDERETGISRNALVEILQAENVRARRYFYPGCHRMEPYRSRFARSGAALPVTEELVTRVMVLPTGTAIRPDEIEIVCGVIRMAVANAAELVPRLASAFTHEGKR